MYREFVVGLALLTLTAAVPLLSACHTTAGAGQDISAIGQAIDKLLGALGGVQFNRPWLRYV